MNQLSTDKSNYPSRIHSLTGLKAVAMLMIFWWHLPIPTLDFDIGAQMCQLLFICSGFLCGYSSVRKNTFQESLWKDSFVVCWKKLKAFWPLHTLFALICFVFLSDHTFTYEKIFRLVLNLLLLQAWHPDSEIAFSFNGTSWFLSSLLFCFFLSPVLCKTIRRKTKFVVIALSITILIRVAIGYVCELFPITLSYFNTYTFPPIRALEFYMGILIVPIFLLINENLKRISNSIKTLVLTFIELLYYLSLVWFLLNCSEKISYSLTALVYLPLIIIFACNEGMMSKILSLKPFRIFGTVQLQFFIIHQVIIKLLQHYNVIDQTNYILFSAVAFFITLIISCLFYYLKKLITKHTQRIKL